MHDTIETLVKKQQDQVAPAKSAPSFSLTFAIASRVNGVDLLSTVPGSDGTIGGSTPYTTNDDGKEKSDDQEDDDQR